MFDIMGHMTRPIGEYDEAMRLLSDGFAQAEVARMTGIPRSSIRSWIERGPGRTSTGAASCSEEPCPHVIRAVAEPAYAYLLGLYLGDGSIATYPRGVYRIRFALDRKYPGIIAECEQALALVYPSRINRVVSPGWLEVASYSKHWPCLVPQHGAGPKHKRPIVLEPWQHQAVIVEHPKLLLRGLIHSDGCRATNTVRRPYGTYAYPRYFFSNRSEDIKNIFRLACAQVGIVAKEMNRWNLTVARQEDVKRLDEFVGPKR